MQDGAGDICLQVRFLTNLLWLIFETFWSLCRCDRAERLLALLQEKVRSGTYAGGSGANAGGGASTRDRTASTDAPPGEEANHHQHSTDSLTRQISSEPGAPAPPSRVPPVGHPAAAAASGLAPGQGNVPDYANVNCNGGGPVTLEASDGYLVGHLTALKIQCWRTRWRTFFLSADPVASAASVVVTAAAAAAIAAFVVDVVAAAATADVAATATVLFSFSFSIARFRKIVFILQVPNTPVRLDFAPGVAAEESLASSSREYENVAPSASNGGNASSSSSRQRPAESFLFNSINNNSTSSSRIPPMAEAEQESSNQCELVLAPAPASEMAKSSPAAAVATAAADAAAADVEEPPQINYIAVDFESTAASSSNLPAAPSSPSAMSLQQQQQQQQQQELRGAYCTIDIDRTKALSTTAKQQSQVYRLPT